MNHFAILSSRKRSVIALIHTVVFLAIATLQLLRSHASPFSVNSNQLASGIALIAIYSLVTTILLMLFRKAAGATERIYFGLCATSAALGLIRVLLGDPVLHASLLRVMLLSAAVITGAVILRRHSFLQSATPDKAQPQICLQTEVTP